MLEKKVMNEQGCILEIICHLYWNVPSNPLLNPLAELEAITTPACRAPAFSLQFDVANSHVLQS